MIVMLSLRFMSYIQRTSNICIYQLGEQILSPKLYFPNVRTATLIQCQPKGVSRILTPEIFPNLKAVHYLSANPGQADVDKRFSSSVQWLFPNGHYIFYKCMMEAGRGQIENRLIRTYIHHYRKTEGGDRLQINLPNYGVQYGNIYRSQLHHYLQNQHRVLTTEYDIEDTPIYVNPFEHYTHFDCGDASTSLHEFMQQKMEREFFDALIQDNKKYALY